MKPMIAIPQSRAMISHVTAIGTIGAVVATVITRPRLSLVAIVADRHPHLDMFGQSEARQVPVARLAAPTPSPLLQPIGSQTANTTLIPQSIFLIALTQRVNPCQNLVAIPSLNPS
jgi:hypothetical protein